MDIPSIVVNACPVTAKKLVMMPVPGLLGQAEVSLLLLAPINSTGTTTSAASNGMVTADYGVGISRLPFAVPLLTLLLTNIRAIS